MNYTAFKTYLGTFIWRPNDEDLAANLDDIIVMANHEISRLLDIQAREVTVAIAPETESFVLPADFKQMKSLTNTDPSIRDPKMLNSTLANVLAQRVRTQSFYQSPYYYVQRGEAQSVLELCGPYSASTPGSFILSYRTDIPDYQATDASWVATDYLDFYVYMVLKHVAIFLREDDRIQEFTGYSNNALTSVLDEDKRLVEFGGSGTFAKPHRRPPIVRRR